MGSSSGRLKQGWVGKIQPFSSFKHQHLEKVAQPHGAKVTVTYEVTSIDTKIDDLG